MIGQDYFDLRSRLGSALFALRGIANDSSVSKNQAAVIDGLVNGLKDPFMFVVVGEVNVGKSTFLNALLGADLSKTGVMPTTEKIHYFKYGSELRRVPVTGTLEEVYAPVEILRDFNVVDTPGTNSIENEHQEITERFVPTADLVIFVFSAMNPWAASAWQFLEKVHQQWLRNVIFVLQQSDLREPEEIQSILAYMKRLCGQRFGREFPIFPVSAKRAHLARSSGVDREKLLAESGFNNLEQHISGVIGASSARLGKLGASLRAARRILDLLQGDSASITRERLQRSDVLREIDARLADGAQRTFDKLSEIGEQVSAGLQRSVQGAVASGAGQLTAREALRSVFREKRSFSEIEKRVQEDITGAEPERWKQAAVILKNDVSAAADELQSRLAAGLNVHAGGELRPAAAFWEAQRRTFLEKVDGIERRVSSELGIAKELAPALRSSRRLALWQIVSTVTCVAVAVACGAAGWWIASACALAVAVAVFLLLAGMNSRTFARRFSDCAARLAVVPSETKNGFDLFLREETEVLYEGFNRVLAPVREKLADQERRQTMLHWQIENLARTFAGLDAEIGPAASPAD